MVSIFLELSRLIIMPLWLLVILISFKADEKVNDKNYKKADARAH